MTGRIKRKQLPQPEDIQPRPAEPVCPLCERPIPRSQRDAHHLVPKSRGGTATQFLHRICHKQVHALLTEKELERHYNTPDALLSHPEIRAFVTWVRSKPNDFYQRTAKSDRIRTARRSRSPR